MPLTSLPAYATTPFSAAFTAAPNGAEILIPSLNKPLFFAPYADKILPRNGHENFELERATTFGNCCFGFEDIFCFSVFFATVFVSAVFVVVLFSVVFFAGVIFSVFISDADTVLTLFNFGTLIF